MINADAKAWLIESFNKGTLSALFIDCQIQEHRKLPKFHSHFNRAAHLAHRLREHKIKISHFMMDIYAQKDASPFKYKNKIGNIRLPSLDFAVVTPHPEELIYPKIDYNGFTNRHATQILRGNNFPNKKNRT